MGCFHRLFHLAVAYLLRLILTNHIVPENIADDKPPAFRSYMQFDGCSRTKQDEGLPVRTDRRKVQDRLFSENNNRTFSL